LRSRGDRGADLTDQAQGDELDDEATGERRPVAPDPVADRAVPASAQPEDPGEIEPDAPGTDSHPRRPVDRAHARELFERYVADRDQAVRAELIELHRPLVEYLARRFRNRGEPLEDLVQVGTIGLLKAIDRFDLDREVEFSTYATPTIVGELKRHFRDKGWTVRVPRRLQELNLTITRAVAALSQEIGRSPTIAEIAAKVGMSEEEVLEGMESANAYQVVSLDAPAGMDDAQTVSEHIGSEDEGLEALEYRAALEPLIAELPERERRILYLRFFRGMTQSQIAARLGISQMHVSRLLNRTLSALRRGLLEEDESA
jgi:RNA polymerase sigma-B factor